MAQLGSDKLSAAQSTNGVNDIAGVPLISTNNDFDASPLGIAARSQALYGIANAQFNLLPPDPSAEIADQQNPLPYWSVDNYSGGRIIPDSYYDTTTGTWSVELNPTAGSAADYLTMKTRSYLLTDDNLALRQKAYLTMSKGTAYAGATQFNVVLSAEYFDVNGTSLSSYAIGTALDNGAMTSISGITTSGSAAISASAAYVDFTIQLNVTATVTSGVKVYLKSFFIQTSQAATGSFVIAQKYTANDTWTRPTGVNYVTVVALGAGGGATRGAGTATVNGAGGTAQVAGGAGGGSGRWAILRDIYVGDVASVSIGIGAGGAGVAGTTVSKAAASTAYIGADNGTASAGGATTFGSYLSVPGGGAGTTTTGGPAGGTATTTIYGIEELAGAAGGNSSGANGTAAAISAFTGGAPFTTLLTGGTAQNGKDASRTGGAGTASVGGTGSTVAGLSGSGASGGTARVVGSTTTSGVGGNGASGGSGAGGGGVSTRASAIGTYTVVGGAGGTALANSGSGGGGGGAALIGFNSQANYDASVGTVTCGAGGSGQNGFLTVVYVA